MAQHAVTHLQLSTSQILIEYLFDGDSVAVILVEIVQHFCLPVQWKTVRLHYLLLQEIGAICRLLKECFC